MMLAAGPELSVHRFSYPKGLLQLFPTGLHSRIG
jgi:hypothetical protein